MKKFILLLGLISSMLVFSQKAVVATGSTHQYVSVNNTTHRFVAQNVSTEMRAKLKYFVETKKQIVTAIAFTPTGGWTILTTKSNWTRNVGGDYHKEIKKVYQQRAYVVDVAFNPAHWSRLKGFAFTTSNGKVIKKHVGGSHTDRDRWLLNLKRFKL